MNYDQELQEVQYLPQLTRPQKKNDIKGPFYVFTIPFADRRVKYGITVLLTCVFRILHVPTLSSKLMHD